MNDENDGWWRTTTTNNFNLSGGGCFAWLFWKHWVTLYAKARICNSVTLIWRKSSQIWHLRRRIWPEPPTKKRGKNERKLSRANRTKRKYIRVCVYLFLLFTDRQFFFLAFKHHKNCNKKSMRLFLRIIHCSCWFLYANKHNILLENIVNLIEFTQ